MKKTTILMMILWGATPVLASTPQQVLSSYSGEAAKAQPGFSPSAERGRQFYMKRWSASATMPGCFSCHTDNPAASGSHVITAKLIEPLTPAANAERFSAMEKVEKWFRRNCTEVLGRECTAGEKADFIQFLLNRK